MKRGYIIVCLFIMQLNAVAQLNNGGFHAQFGVDADTKADFLKYGPSTGAIASDDWFSSSSSYGKGVIDTSNTAYLRSQLQSGINISFVKRMPVPLYTNVNGTIWLDAVYGRDYIVNTTNDSTAFTGGLKNGDDPATWQGTVSPVADKTDLVDVYGHMRRNGSSVHDSLWFYTGAATTGTSGARYFDIELYKNNISYNRTTGAFSSGGPNAGHTQWIFDAAGNITQTGDMIVAVSYAAGGVPSVEFRIWVSNTTFSTVTPNLFKFGTSFNGSTASFGYASILAKNGSTGFGSGIANYSANANADTTYATPWGSQNGAGWVSQYGSLQFIEVGLNLTRIGLDPALYTSVLNSGACRSSFATIFFKSRSSPSFTSNLQDFVGPFDFLQVPVLDYALATPPLLTCRNPTGNINVLNNTTAGYYTWTTLNGTINGTASNSVEVSKGGTYILKAAVADGCPVIRTDTITVPADTFPPVASFYLTTTEDMRRFILHGGSTTASNYATPFGGSQGLQWNWSGPHSFSSTLQNPETDTTAYGIYQLIVTENRNGCTDTTVDFVNFAVLSPTNVTLQAVHVNAGIVLKWKTMATGIAVFEVEKSTDGIRYTRIASTTGTSFTDSNPGAGLALYRVRMINTSNALWYSNIVSFDLRIQNAKKIYLATTNQSMRLVAFAETSQKGKIVVYNGTGAILFIKDVVLQQGQNNYELPVPANSLQIVSLFINGQLQFSQKTIFRH